MMKSKSLLDDVRCEFAEKPIWNLISTSWFLAFSYIYFEEFIYSFSGKPVDPDINHAIGMMVIASIGFFVLRFIHWLFARKFIDPIGTDEMDESIFHRSLPIVYTILWVGVLLSLLGWKLHRSTDIVFHCVFLTLWFNFGVYHFIIYSKHMTVMEKPSLFSLDNEE